jgi:16S rRNA (guanine966-N2)-methyltransferase
MRIIGGEAKGRRLDTPDEGTRPLTGRAREALFSILGETVKGATVLDLFAGSGSFGLEALSRGAAEVMFVERDRRAVEVLERNIGAVDLGGTVERSTVTDYLVRSDASFDMVFVDPPYALEDSAVDRVLSLVEGRLNDGATVIVHRRSGGARPKSDNLRLADKRRYGDTELWVFAKEGA